MTVYTVHEPRPRRRERAAAPERYKFVRDGFYFWAFLLGPLWMLWHRLWLVLVFYCVVMAGAEAALWALGVSAWVKFVVGLLIAVLVGCEAASLRRWSLRRWTQVGLVVAPDLEEAERRYFSSVDAEVSPQPVAPPPNVSAPPSPPPSSEVIGLFPEPQPRS